MLRSVHFYQCLATLVSVTVLCLILYNSTLTSFNARTDYQKYAKTFLAAGTIAGLELFIAEPDILRAIDSGKDRRSLWISPRTTRSLTFGVIDPSYRALRRLSDLLSINLAFHRYVITDTERRSVSIQSFVGKRKLPTIPMHFLWWSGDGKNQSTLILHLVIFRTRGDYLWHGQLTPLPLWHKTKTNSSSFKQSLPFPVSDFAIGHHPALIDRFRIQKMTIGNMALAIPNNITSFLHNLKDGALVECNHGTAQYLLKTYPNLTLGADKTRQEMMQILIRAVKTLDSVGVTFWLSSGTLLGWYRQCDVIPYTSDIDLEMRIEDYTPKIIVAMGAAGQHLWRRLGKLHDGFELTFREHLRIDLFFLYEETNYTYVTMFHPTTYQKYRYVFPKYGLRWTEFGGLKVRVPYPPEAYLESCYGMEWYEPKVNYNWLYGPSNIVPHDFWPEKERKDLRRYYF